MKGPTQVLIVSFVLRWLKERAENDTHFVSSLFYRSAAANRLKTCVHNPAHLKEFRWCYKRQTADSTEEGMPNDPRDGMSNTSDLAEEVRFANVVLAYMMALDKCDVFIMNPLFGSSIPYKVAQDQLIVDYYAKGRPELSPRSLNRTHSSNDSSESGSWMDDYPLHRAAYLDKPDLIKHYLAQGCDPNQPDRDSWTPLHYASWYGNLSAVKALLNYGNCSVNQRNKNGSTPLHFAAWCGHRYVTELLLTHPDINVTIRDNDGKTPADLCDCVPKEDWLAVATLLKNSNDGKLPKIQIDLLDGSNIMLPLINGKETLAVELQREIIKELNLEEKCANLFALWISSLSLQLQLKADHKPLQHLIKWKEKILPQWVDCQEHSLEEPKLSFRRNARISLAEERQARIEISLIIFCRHKFYINSCHSQIVAIFQLLIIELNESALALLFHEAHSNFVKGLYPCENQDVIYLSAVVIQIIHGDFDSKKDRQLFKK
ncbi:unnamed protein product [Soboliphyme baturini]|uniref:FERM domain-containing protein n=1 Tax=Soboliphyme baturini TaxID=241478 RepID=A0A183J250_9BILA|nr:unnamed protein product [Soboliphyme baturini]